MADPNIRIKRSAVPGKKPTVVQLPLGELALNTYDAQLFAQVDTGGVGIGTTIISLTPWKETFGAESIFYSNSVGIGTDNVTENLTLLGNASVSAGITLGGTLSFGESSAISIGGSTGSSGQYLQSTGIGLTWASASSLRSENTYTATSAQTTISQAYTTGLIDVFVNGVRLHSSEYVASNGTSIVLNEALFGGESIDVISYTSSGSVSSVPENDTLDSVTTRGSNTTNDINVGISSAKDGVNADVIRRYTDNGTSTKITLESGRLKFFAGNGVSPKVNINGGVGISTNLNVVGISTFNQDVNVGSDQSTGIVLTSPNGTKYRLIVDNSGNLSTTAV